MAMKLVDAEQLEADLTSVADSIRAKTGGEDALSFPSGFVDALDTIESADSALAELEYNLSNGYTDYDKYCYARTYMREVPMEIMKYIENAVSVSYMFYTCSSLVEIPSLTFLKEVQMAQCFYSCASLQKIGELITPKAVSFFCCFQNCTKLHTIEGIDLSSAKNVNNMFSYCSALENITFNGVIKISGLNLSPCTALTHDSLMSAINALYDWASEGGTSTYTLTLGSTNLGKLTDAEKAIATQKGWTLA